VKKKIKRKRSRLPKSQIYKMTTMLYHFLYGEEKVILKKIHNASLEGYFDEETEGIVVDYRKSLLPTLIHEFLHKIHVDWPERKVRKYESRIVNSLTHKQIKNILRALGNNI
jgi:hypothetical protein